MGGLNSSCARHSGCCVSASWKPLAPALLVFVAAFWLNYGRTEKLFTGARTGIIIILPYLFLSIQKQKKVGRFSYN